MRDCGDSIDAKNWLNFLILLNDVSIFDIRIRKKIFSQAYFIWYKYGVVYDINTIVDHNHSMVFNEYHAVSVRNLLELVNSRESGQVQSERWPGETHL